MDAENLNIKMLEALWSGDKSLVRIAVEAFVSAFHENCYLIDGSEYALHTAAKCFAFIGERGKALEFVRLAEWNGYDNLKTMERDEDLKPLWNHPAFKEIFEY